MHLFYTPDIIGNEYTLPEEESKHCIKVLRLEVGDEIFLIDGKGGFYQCEIIQAQLKRCEVRCIRKNRKLRETGLPSSHCHCPDKKYRTDRMVFGKMYRNRD